MKTIKLLVIMTLLLSISLSCSDDDDVTLDNEIPTVEVMEPHEDDEFEPGAELHVKARLADNVELSQIKIDIHYSGDGHTHGILSKEGEEGEEWIHDFVKNISGTAYELDEIIQIPEFIEHNGEMHGIKHGSYHFGVYVIDASGNETQAFLDFKIEAHHEGDDHTHDHD